MMNRTGGKSRAYNSPRRAAVAVLMSIEAGEGLCDSLIERACREGRFTGRDRAFLSRLVLECTRRRITLDAVIQAFSGRDPAALLPGLRASLRTGAFEILFSRDPRPWAATNEAVESARAMAGRGAAGLCNAVMRKIAGGSRRVCGAELPADRRTLRTGPVSAVSFDRDVLPDSSDRLLRMSVVHSHPRWLAERFASVFGIEGAERVLSEGNRVPPLFVRSRTGSRPAAGRESGPVFVESRFEDVFAVEGGPPIASLEGFRSGELAVQDETATAPVRSLGLEPGMLVLDACAAPGGKAVQAADAMGGRGTVVAADVERARLARLLDNAQRTGARGILCVCADARRPPFKEGSFDRVLVDAPCSNTGVLRRRAEARFRLSAFALDAIASTQSVLLRACAPLVRKGGLVVYSTCSIEPSENQAVAEWFEARHPGFIVEKEETVLPGRADGGYHAVLARR